MCHGCVNQAQTRVSSMCADICMADAIARFVHVHSFCCYFASYCVFPDDAPFRQCWDPELVTDIISMTNVRSDANHERRHDDIDAGLQMATLPDRMAGAGC